MSYKKNIDQIGQENLKALEENADAILLAKVGNKYLEIQEYIAYVEKIVKRDYEEISIIYLRFKGGKKLKTSAFIDNTIQEKCFVSVVGYETDIGYGLQFYCKGGINRVYTRLGEIKSPKNKIYKVGLVLGLSDINEAKTYNETEKIQALGDTGFYYMKESISSNEMKLNNLYQKVTDVSNLPIEDEDYQDVTEDVVSTIENEGTISNN